MEKSLDLLTPQQRKALLEQCAKMSTGPVFSQMFGGPIAFTAYPALDEDTFQQLGLSEEQRNRLETIQESSSNEAQGLVATQQEMGKLAKEQRAAKKAANEVKAKQIAEALKAKNAELERKTNELGQRMREEIDAVLTPQQLTQLKEISARREAVSLLTNPFFVSHPEELKQSLGLTLSEEQQKELQRLNKEAFDVPTLSPEEDRRIREQTMKILTPPQRELVEQEAVRNAGRGVGGTTVTFSSGSVNMSLGTEAAPDGVDAKAGAGRAPAPDKASGAKPAAPAQGGAMLFKSGSGTMVISGTVSLTGTSSNEAAPSAGAVSAPAQQAPRAADVPAPSR
jgi:hypothetical protein